MTQNISTASDALVYRGKMFELVHLPVSELLVTLPK